MLTKNNFSSFNSFFLILSNTKKCEKLSLKKKISSKQYQHYPISSRPHSRGPDRDPLFFIFFYLIMFVYCMAWSRPNIYLYLTSSIWISWCIGSRPMYMQSAFLSHAVARDPRTTGLGSCASEKFQIGLGVNAYLSLEESPSVSKMSQAYVNHHKINKMF